MSVKGTSGKDIPATLCYLADYRPVLSSYVAQISPLSGTALRKMYAELIYLGNLCTSVVGVPM